MKMPNLVRLIGLCLIVFVTALTAFAAPPAPEPCSCEFCSRTGPQRSCTLDGTTTTCGVFLSFTTCVATV